MSKMNGVVENGKAKWRKLPFYAAYPITRSGEKIAKYAKKGFDYTDLHGNEQMHKFRENIIGLMQDGFKDKEIKHAYQGFFHAFEGITSLLGKSVSAIGNAAHDKIHTNNQRAILGSFFEAASKEEDLMTLMQSSDLANLLNLKESGPYLFDNDGRSLSATKKGPKEYSEDEAGANEYMKDQSKQIMDEQHKILKQYTDRMNAEYEANEEQLASMSVVDPEYSKVQKALEGAMIKQEALRSKETSISDMISALQNFLRSGDVNVFESTVNTLHKEFKDTKDNSDTIITNAQSTLKAQTKIKEDKAKELADINDKLSRLNSTDKGYKELSDERITADGERIKKRNTLRTLEDKIRDNIGDKQKHEKKRDYLESEVKELKKKAERKTEYNNAVDMLNELEKDLETKRALLENIKQEERQNNGGGRGKN